MALPKKEVVKVEAANELHVRMYAATASQGDLVLEFVCGEDDRPAGGETEVKLDTQLENLLHSAQTGDPRTLQKMNSAVRKFLQENNARKQERRSVRLLLKQPGFVKPLLLKGIRGGVDRMPALVADSLWILNVILGCLDKSTEEAIKVLVKADVLPSIIKIVGGRDNCYGVVGLALSALELLGGRGFLNDLGTLGSTLIASLTKLAKAKNCNEDTHQKIIHIVCAVMGQVRMVTVKDFKKEPVGKAKGFNEIMDNLPPLGLFKESFPLMNTLLNSKNELILRTTLTCLAFGCRLSESFQPVIASGILKKVATLFSHKDENVKLLAIVAISSMICKSDAKALTFLKSMKGTFALKDFYLSLINRPPVPEGEETDSLLLAAEQFFTSTVNAVAGSQDVVTLSAVLTSGFVESMVHCLKSRTNEQHVLGASWAIGRISSEVPLSSRRWVVEAGALPYLVDLLKDPNEIITSMAAVSIGNLVQEKPLNRDLVVSLGAVKLLTKLVKRKGSCIQGLISVLAALELLVDIRPPPSLEVIKDIPGILLSVLDDKSLKFPDKLIPGIYSIISKICDCGSGGIDIVIKSGFVPRIQAVLSGVGHSNEDTQVFALETITVITRGSVEQREAINTLEMVEALIELLTSQTKYIRTVALCILANMYKGKGELKPECKECIKKMVPQVFMDMTKKDPRANHPAGQGLAFKNVLSNFTFR